MKFFKKKQQTALVNNKRRESGRLGATLSGVGILLGLFVFGAGWGALLVAGIPLGIIEVCAVSLVACIPMLVVRKTTEWERVIVLRFGRFHKVKGPGLFIAIPFIDKIARLIDLRIRVTDFSAQETLTLDSVTISVDAICFWLVWDPEKAVLEVQNYEEAVILSAKTALRNAVSSHDLTMFLERSDIIAKQLQNDVDKKTTEWGVTIQYIEITDILVPETLQDSLSRLAQAEREKKSRIMLAEAEIEIAKKLKSAVDVYAGNENAMKLKILSILNEGLKAGNSMMLVPNEITKELKTKDVFGLEAITMLQKTREPKSQANQQKPEMDAGAHLAPDEE
jgi:regulator of protease activity HflC (stomatin/prohibitin superfamily)